MKLSKEKRDKICEQILGFLYHEFPKSHFCATISKEIARDEEFIKSLLFDLDNKGMLTLIKKNQKGKDYKKRQRWRLSNKAYEAYKQHQ